jgi:hypothetical protein
LVSTFAATTGAGAAAFFATTLGSVFLDVTEAFVTGALVGATAVLAAGFCTVFVTALDVLPTALAAGFFVAGLTTTLLTFETVLLVALFDDFAVTASFGFAVAFFVGVFAATLLAFTGVRTGAGLVAFVLVAEVLTIFLIAFAIGPSTKWGCQCCIGNWRASRG